MYKKTLSKKIITVLIISAQIILPGTSAFAVNEAQGSGDAGSGGGGGRNDDSACEAYKDTQKGDFIIGAISMVAAYFVAKKFCPAASKGIKKVFNGAKEAAKVAAPITATLPPAFDSDIEGAPGAGTQVTAPAPAGAAAGPGGMMVCMMIAVPLAAKGIQALVSGIRRSGEIKKCEGRTSVPTGDGTAFNDGLGPPVTELSSDNPSVGTADFGGAGAAELLPQDLPLNMGEFPTEVGNALNGMTEIGNGLGVNINDPASVEDAKNRAIASGGAGAQAAADAAFNGLASSAEFKAEMDKVKKNIESRFGKGSSDTAGFTGGGRGFGGGGGGEEDYGNILRQQTEAPRRPNGAAGLTRTLADGSAVGLARDNLFNMVSDRYTTMSRSGRFLPPVLVQPRQPASRRRF